MENNIQPKKTEKQSVKSFSIQQQYSSFQGPFPPPAIMREYKEIYEPMPRIIVEKFVKQVDHRIEMERLAVPNRERLAARGQLYAFLIAILGILSAVVCAYFKQEVIGSILGGTTILTLAKYFIGPKETSDKKDNQK